MKKRVSRAFDKEIYLLGKDRDGKLRWLEAPSWECGWYWGFGYVETYTNNKNPSIAKDIYEHTHIDSLFFHKLVDCFDSFKKFFVETPFTDEEIWKLLELFHAAYTLKGTAELYHIGGSHITENPCAKVLKSPERENCINTILLPTIFEQIKNILTK